MNTKSEVSFLDQLASAFALASTLFLPVAIAWFNSVPAANGPQWVLYAIAEAIILVAIFVVAFPIERFLIKPQYSAIHAAGYYFLVFGGIFLLAIAFGRMFAGSSIWFIYAVVIYVSAIGGIIAIIARLVYPFVLRFSKYTKWLAAGYVVLSLASLVSLATAH
ncbi:MAG: hypothetical protein ACKOWH_01570 [Rhodoluna sp.]